MRKLIAYIALSCITVLMTSFSGLPPAKGKDFIAESISRLYTNSSGSISTEASLVYLQLDLKEKGLSEEAFVYAYKGYQRLLKKKVISPTSYLTICDFSQSAKQKRLYIIDLANDKIIMHTYVAHGHNSGGVFATRFSNKLSSKQSSLGFYVTKNTYRGENGLSLRVEGLEPGFNDKAYRRAIVIHGADYIGDGSTGRSYGCPAVPKKECKTIINTIKNGTCLFIYHPEKKYLQRSKILND